MTPIANNFPPAEAASNSSNVSIHSNSHNHRNDKSNSNNNNNHNHTGKSNLAKTTIKNLFKRRKPGRIASSDKLHKSAYDHAATSAEPRSQTATSEGRRITISKPTLISDTLSIQGPKPVDASHHSFSAHSISKAASTPQLRTVPPIPHKRGSATTLFNREYSSLATQGQNHGQNQKDVRNVATPTTSNLDRAAALPTPLPLYKAYSQSLKRIRLPTPVAPAETIIRNNKKRSTLNSTPNLHSGAIDNSMASRRHDDASGFSSMNGSYRRYMAKRASIFKQSVELCPKVFVLVPSGHIHQYSTEGEFDRVPEKTVTLGPNAVAFASDAIPGKLWVVEITESAGGEQRFVPTAQSADHRRTIFNRLSMMEQKPMRSKSMLLVFDSSGEMDTWLALLKKEIDYFSTTAAKEGDKNNLNILNFKQDDYDDDDSVSSPIDSVQDTDPKLSRFSKSDLLDLGLHVPFSMRNGTGSASTGNLELKSENTRRSTTAPVPVPPTPEVYRRIEPPNSSEHHSSLSLPEASSKSRASLSRSMDLPSIQEFSDDEEEEKEEAEEEGYAGNDTDSRAEGGSISSDTAPTVDLPDATINVNPRTAPPTASDRNNACESDNFDRNGENIIETIPNNTALEDERFQASGPDDERCGQHPSTLSPASEPEAGSPDPNHASLSRYSFYTARASLTPSDKRISRQSFLTVSGGKRLSNQSTLIPSGSSCSSSPLRRSLLNEKRFSDSTVLGDILEKPHAFSQGLGSYSDLELDKSETKSLRDGGLDLPDDPTFQSSHCIAAKNKNAVSTIPIAHLASSLDPLRKRLAIHELVHPLPQSTIANEQQGYTPAQHPSMIQENHNINRLAKPLPGQQWQYPSSCRSSSSTLPPSSQRSSMSLSRPPTALYSSVNTNAMGAGTAFNNPPPTSPPNRPLPPLPPNADPCRQINRSASSCAANRKIAGTSDKAPEVGLGVKQ